jgi:hypothetical protein
MPPTRNARPCGASLAAIWVGVKSPMSVADSAPSWLALRPEI